MKESGEQIADSIFDLIGETPMMKLNKIPEMEGVEDTEIVVKLEKYNPSGSLKDRVLYNIIKNAEISGDLEPGMTLIEGTTGNTGIATSWIGAVLGYDVKIVMPGGMSEERKKLFELYGADLVETPGGESDVDITLEKVQEIIEENPDKYFWVGQFHNPDNVEAHYFNTGKEIWEQTNGNLDAVVCSQGTGGTISGISRYIKERDENVKAYAMEPEECPIITKGQWGSHHIEGIGDGFIPENLHLQKMDGIITTSSEEAIDMSIKLAKEEGIFTGISSGANVKSAIKVAKEHPEYDRIVTIICDNGDRYYSTAIFGQEKELDTPEREDTTIRPEDEEKLKELHESGHELEYITDLEPEE